MVPYGKPAVERELQGFGTARVAEMRKKSLFSPGTTSGLVFCASGDVFATAAEHIPALLGAGAGVSGAAADGEPWLGLLTNPGASHSPGAHSLLRHGLSPRCLSSAPLSARALVTARPAHSSGSAGTSRLQFPETGAVIVQMRGLKSCKHKPSLKGNFFR